MNTLADVTAVELARRLRVDPKRFRGWLRTRARAGDPLLVGHEHNARWVFPPEVARQLEAAFSGKAPATATASVSPRGTSVTATAAAGRVDDLDRAHAARDLDRLPDAPGLYAFWIDETGLGDLGGAAPAQERALYVGKAEDSIRSRVRDTHCAAGKTGWSTLRRTLAALLDLQAMPRPGGGDIGRRCTSYGLVPGDEARLTAWMEQNLSVSYALSASPSALEPEALRQLQPLLNIAGATWPSELRDRATAGRRRLSTETRNRAEGRRPRSRPTSDS